MCEIIMKHDEIRIIVVEIFRIVIIIMYITPSMLHLSNCNLIILYEFVTNRNITCTELMSKTYQASLRMLDPAFKSEKHQVYTCFYEIPSHVLSTFKIRCVTQMKKCLLRMLLGIQGK